MATEIKSWQIVNGKLTQVSTSLIESGRKEKDDLEEWIKSNPEIIGNDIAIIGEQVQTKSGPLDFLGIDKYGNMVIVELKRDKLPREALAQAIDYASDIATYEKDFINEICLKFSGQTLENYLSTKFPDINLDGFVVNQTQRLLLVGFSVEESLHRMIEWLSEKYSIGINAIVLHYIKTHNGEELLSRTVIIPEEIDKENITKKKFVIEMSDEAGSYETDILKDKIRNYLKQDLWSSKRMKDYFIPTLLEKGTVTRSQMRKEFAKLDAAPDEKQAGYFLALISTQLGMKKNDFLRQIIDYKYPNYQWEKDNFSIRTDYIELIKEILNTLNPVQ
jgi:hypothetical protein